MTSEGQISRDEVGREKGRGERVCERERESHTSKSVARRDNSSKALDMERDKIKCKFN